MTTTCPHCSVHLELDPETYAALQSQTHFECPSCHNPVPVPPPPGTQPVAPLRVAGALVPPSRPRSAPAATLGKAHRGINRNLLILGSVALLVLGGLGFFLASRGGSIFNSEQKITNQIIHNSYFTRLIASGATTEKDLQTLAMIRPYGSGFIGVSKEALPWLLAQDYAKRTGAEILAMEDSSAGSKQQLIDWLPTALPTQLTTPVWVRENGQACVLDGADMMAVKVLDRPRRVLLQWCDRPTDVRANQEKRADPTVSVPAPTPTAAPLAPSPPSDPAQELRKRAEAGDAAAQYQLACTYPNHWDFSIKENTKEVQEMIGWLKKSAEQGYGDAEYYLANCYQYGKGGTQDQAEAVRWFIKAAAHGVDNACLHIGGSYKNGWGVPKDAVEAAKWFRQGSKGDVFSLLALGRLYLEGDVGVPKDLVQALICLDLTLSRGVGSFKADVEGYRDTCVKQMTAEQIAEAKRLAPEWKPEAAQPRIPPTPTDGPVVTPALPVHRVLTDTSGRKLDATILERTATDIKCTRTSDGVEFSIALAKLSLADRRFLAELDKPALVPPLAPTNQKQ